MADGAAAEEANAAEPAAGTLRASWEAATLVACITEEGQVEGRQRNVGSSGDRNAGSSGDKDAATGTVCGTSIFLADQTHMTSGTPSGVVATTQEGAVIKIGLDSVRKDDGLHFPLCAPSTLRASKFKQFKLLGRPRRVLRNDDCSTGSDESVEVADRNSGDSGTGASDSIKTDARKSLSNELPRLAESSTEAKAEPEKKESGCEKVAPQTSQSQGDDGERLKVRPFNGLEDIKGELQALQLLSKQQRKLVDLPKPPGSIDTFRADPQVAVKLAITGLEQLVSRCTRADSNLEQDGKEKDISPLQQQRKVSPSSRQEEIPKPKSPVGSQVQSAAASLPATAQEVILQRDAVLPKGEAKVLPPRTEEQLPKEALLPRTEEQLPKEALPKGASDEVNKQKPAETVSRKAKESANFVMVSSKRYQKLGKIGSGGSSDVFKVIAQDCTIYALKRIILKGRDHQTAFGFHQEIEYLERLRDRPHIIQLIDYEVTDKNIFQSNRSSRGDIQTDACIYMVLEYGEIDLARMLERKKREMSEEKRLDENWLRLYWEHILKAVNTIHEERIVHADLKPANFLLVQGVLKLIDFGIAKAIQNDTTNIVRDSQVGTLNYMSPEAFMMNSRDEHGTVKCGRASDIWSLGCILYQMVYGRTPFSHLNFYQKITEITNPRHEIEFPAISNPLILDVIKSCLVWDKSKRPRIPQLLEHPFLKPRVSEDVAGLQFTREALLQSCKVYVSVRGTLELTDLMRKVVKGATTTSTSSNSGSSLEQQYQQLDDALLRLSRLYMHKAGKTALHELLTQLL